MFSSALPSLRLYQDFASGEACSRGGAGARAGSGCVASGQGFTSLSLLELLRGLRVTLWVASPSFPGPGQSRCSTSRSKTGPPGDEQRRPELGEGPWSGACSPPLLLQKWAGEATQVPPGGSWPLPPVPGSLFLLGLR